jgi:hypothetical protein
MGDDVLSISLLGAFSVTVGGDVIPENAWRLRKAKTLIKLLALAPECRLHADRPRCSQAWGVPSRSPR